MPIANTKLTHAEKAISVSTKRKPIQLKDTRQALNMRIRPEVRHLIDRAAELTGKSRTDFVLDAARHAAEDALLDRTTITLNPKSYAAFVALLDAPPLANERLRKTMTTKSPWE